MKSEIVMFSEPLMGRVLQAIAPDRVGEVHCQSSYLPATFYESDCQARLCWGEPVSVVGIQGRLLLVIPTAE